MLMRLHLKLLSAKCRSLWSCSICLHSHILACCRYCSGFWTPKRWPRELAAPNSGWSGLDWRKSSDSERLSPRRIGVGWRWLKAVPSRANLVPSTFFVDRDSDLECWRLMSKRWECNTFVLSWNHLFSYIRIKCGPLRVEPSWFDVRIIAFGDHNAASGQRDEFAAVNFIEARLFVKLVEISKILVCKNELRNSVKNCLQQLPSIFAVFFLSGFNSFLISYLTLDSFDISMRF